MATTINVMCIKGLQYFQINANECCLGGNNYQSYATVAYQQQIWVNKQLKISTNMVQMITQQLSVLIWCCKQKHAKLQSVRTSYYVERWNITQVCRHYSLWLLLWMTEERASSKANECPTNMRPPVSWFSLQHFNRLTYIRRYTHNTHEAIVYI